jgi:hypothetical protein
VAAAIPLSWLRVCVEAEACGIPESVLGFCREYPFEFIPAIGGREVACVYIRIPAKALDEGLEEEGGSVPGERLDRGSDRGL